MSIPRSTYRFTPSAEEAGTRLDQFLSGREEKLSRGMVRKIVDLGGVHAGGRRMRRCSYPVQAGELVEVFIDGLPLEPFRLTDEAVIWRDNYLLAIDKPAGVETQPTPARYKGTLYAALLDYLQDPFRPANKPTLGMVQRLDRETSGLMIFSTHQRAHRGLTTSFTGRHVRKRYLALVVGRIPSDEGEFCSLLARNRATNKVKSVDRGGKEAVTRFRLLEAFTDASLVEVEILTGRSHQIRVHFSEAGHPLLGDVRYGGPEHFLGERVPRQMLHSWRLSLPHPITGAPLELEAPPPADMLRLLERLRQEL